MSTAPLRLNGARINQDKTGALVAVVPWEVHTVEETMLFVPPDPPFGLPIVGRNAEEFEVGTWRLEIAYEGTVLDTGVNFEDESALEVELDGSMSQDPIKAHPKFSTVLRKKYGWQALPDDGGRFGFPEFAPGSTGTETALSGATTRQKQSDLYGVEAWLVVGAIFRMSFTRRVAPGWILDGIGEAVEVPRGWNLLGLPRPRGRNWLKLMPRARRAGNATRVTIEYQMSGPRRINRDVYSFDQLGGGSGGGGGLITGGLITGTL